jgi:hypothetical protein
VRVIAGWYDSDVVALLSRHLFRIHGVRRLDGNRLNSLGAALAGLLCGVSGSLALPIYFQSAHELQSAKLSRVKFIEPPPEVCLPDFPPDPANALPRDSSPFATGGQLLHTDGFNEAVRL